MKDIKFKRIFQIPNEGDELNAIVAYKKRPAIMKRKSTLIGDGIYNTETYCAQYEKFLHIDLWIVVMKFYWHTKEINK